MKRLDPLTIYSLTLAAVLVSLFVLAKTTYSVASDEPKEPKFYGSVVRLVMEGRTYCSGVVIDDTTVVTAGHCMVQDDGFQATINHEPVEIRAADNKPLRITGKLKSFSQQLDRAVLKGNFKGFYHSNYISDPEKSTSTRVPGNQFISCGYPMGGQLYCSRLIYQHDMGFFLATKGVIIPGMSGGPTMLLDGTVIAINSAVYDDLSLIAPIYNVDLMK